MLHTVRWQLFFLVLLSTTISIILSLIIFRFYSAEKEHISSTRQDISRIRSIFLNDVNTLHNFLEKETINTEYFKTKNSSLLKKHFQLVSQLKSETEKMLMIKEQDGKTKYQITNIVNTIDAYIQYCNQIIIHITIRGFKDYGLEGKMRNLIHQLESAAKGPEQAEILQLRRHEKDFLLRQEPAYLKLHTNLVRQIIKRIRASNISRDSKNESIATLTKYSKSFLLLAKYEKTIGIKTGTGLKYSLDNQILKLENIFNSTHDIFYQIENTNLHYLNLRFFLIWFFILIISFTIAYLISKKISGSITELSAKIDGFIKSNFTKLQMLPVNHRSKNEIDKLSNNFAILELQIMNQIRALKETNDELQMLLYRSSHDIRNPVCSIKGLIDLGNELANEDSKQTFNLINTSCDNLLRTIDDLKIATTIKITQFDVETINFQSIFENLFLEFRSMSKPNEIFFSCDISVPDNFNSVTTLIKTIFRCLIQNAVNHSVKRLQSSYVKVKINAINAEMIKITVNDNGCGIKEENKAKIFDIFFKNTAIENDTGLGLYIVKNVLNKLNGFIYFESSEDTGTIFTVILPDLKLNQNHSHRLALRRHNEVSSINSEIALNYI